METLEPRLPQEPWHNPRLVSLLSELEGFVDVKPCWMRGAGTLQPWVMPIYGQSAELEVCDLLYALIRYLRPQLVVELGCHQGIGTYALARGCQDAGIGNVVTCDINEDYVHMTQVRCKGLPVVVFREDATECEMESWVQRADFLWLDCHYAGRLKALPSIKPGAVAAIHDTGQEPWLAEEIRKMDGFEYVSFSQTHRGLSIVQRRQL